MTPRRHAPTRRPTSRNRGAIVQWALPLTLVGALVFIGAMTLGDGVESLFKRISACVASPATCQAK